MISIRGKNKTAQITEGALVISIVICTRNRADSLAHVLETTCKQGLAEFGYEIIVVDNGSLDHTRQVTETFSQKFSNVRYILEPRCGLSNARNRGIREAKGRYVAYLDDDCRAPANWLVVAGEIIDSVKPAVFGGPYYPFYDSPKPYWWKDRYGTFEEFSSPRPLRRHEYLRGGNLFIQHKLFETISGFDVDYGMSGRNLAYGEETELQKRIRAGMPDAIIYYDPKLYVYHLVSSEKMSLCWTLRSCFMGGRCSYHIFEDEISRKTGVSRLKLHSKFVLTLLRFVANFLVRLFLRDRKQSPHLQNVFYENTVEYIAKLGRIYEKYKNCQRF